LRHTLILAAFAVSLSACAATREEPAPAPRATAPAPVAAQSECKPAPTDLVIRDLEPGSGKSIVTRSGALVFYTGWLYDGCKPDLKGAQFDSNRGQSVPFSLLVGTGKVIKGWDEGLIGMKAGGKRLLVIPADKAYGSRAIAGRIPANSTLVFEVEVVDIPYQPPESK